MDGISGLKWKWNWEMGGGISERELEMGNGGQFTRRTLTGHV